MNLDCLLKISLNHRIQRSHEHDAGIIDQHVNAGMFFSNSRNRLFDFVRFFSSQGQVENWRVKMKQVGRSPLQLIPISRQQGEVRSIPSEFPGQGQPKTPGSS